MSTAQRRLRILLVVSEAPPIVSGISRCVEHLATGLRAEGHHVDVLSAIEVPRLVIGEVRLSSFVFFWPKVAWHLQDYDIVNVHGPVPTMSDVCLFLARSVPRKRRPPIVYTHHSAIDIEGLGHACDAYNRLTRWLARHADAVVTSTDDYAMQIRSRTGAPVHVVPWGVDASLDGVDEPDAGRRDAPPTGDGDSPRPPLRVIFVGQMRPYKGVDTLLEAVAGLAEVEVVLVGSGPLQAQYERVAEVVGADHAHFVGRVSDGQLTQLYRASDVVVLPSTTRAEAFGLVLLEGMLNSCVPVASDLPGVREIASRSGLVVPPKDPFALRDAIRSLATDRETLLQAQADSCRVAHEMSWDRVVAGYENVFLTTMQGASPHSCPAMVSGMDHAARRPGASPRPGQRHAAGVALTDR